MTSIAVHLGSDARAALREAFDSARETIDAEYFSIGDPEIVASLNRAAARGVRVRVVVEGDPRRFHSRKAKEPDIDRLRGGLDADVDVVISHAPHALVHGKAAIVDGVLAAVGTANPMPSGLDDPGDVIVFDRNPRDVTEVAAKIRAAASAAPDPRPLRASLKVLFASSCDLRVASEGLSDPGIASALARRAREGRHDRVIVDRAPAKASRRVLRQLVRAGVEVRMPEHGHMHEKYVDSGKQIYVGSANLTYDGLDIAREIGIVADAADFGDGADALRADFDAMWSRGDDVIL
jgi:phosphatidylserine/phosphatidylglycerophosphate/cardiolipin synthase-like enzyme